jgi:hypothetical protein
MRLPAPARALPLILACAVGLAGCGSRNEAPAVPSVRVLTEDPILLSRVLERCNADATAVGKPECINARAAADRRMADQQAAKEKQAAAGFEMAREARRRAEEAAARAHDATKKPTDVYELPVEGAEPPASTNP